MWAVAIYDNDRVISDQVADKHVLSFQVTILKEIIHVNIHLHSSSRCFCIHIPPIVEDFKFKGKSFKIVHLAEVCT